MAEERLQKIIARAGVASRRAAEEMIREGRVTVNGRVVSELGSKADIERDHIKVDGKLLRSEREPQRYILLYKPKEVMTTVDDPQGRKTVLDLIKGVRERIFPVGRLDYQSEGLILLTNDGDLAFRVAHPSHGSVKTYHVKVRGVPQERIIEKLERGITIEGRRTLPCEIQQIRTTGRSEEEGNSWFEVKLREGRTQQIRRMFKTVGHPVVKLKRVAIGPISDPSLSPGQWRELTPQELRLLERGGEPAKKRTPAAKRPARKTAPAKTSSRAKRGTTSAAPRAELKKFGHSDKKKSPATRGRSAGRRS